MNTSLNYSPHPSVKSFAYLLICEAIIIIVELLLATLLLSLNSTLQSQWLLHFGSNFHLWQLYNSSKSWIVCLHSEKSCTWKNRDLVISNTWASRTHDIESSKLFTRPLVWEYTFRIRISLNSLRRFKYDVCNVDLRRLGNDINLTTDGNSCRGRWRWHKM